MPDSAAAERDAAEAESAFSHPAVAPDATAAYGDHPDQVIDFYAPRGGAADAGARSSWSCTAAPGGPRTTGTTSPPSPTSWPAAASPWPTSSTGAAARSRRSQGARARSPGRWPETFDDVAAALDALPGARRGGPAAGRPPPHRSSPATPRAATSPCGPRPGTYCPPARPGGCPPRRRCAGSSPWPRSPTSRVAEELDVCGGAARQLLGGDDEFADAPAVRRPGARCCRPGSPPTVVQGRADIVVPQAVAEAYVDAAAKAGETVGLTLLEDVGHFPLIDPAADACAVVAEEIAQLAW